MQRKQHYHPSPVAPLFRGWHLFRYHALICGVYLAWLTLPATLCAAPAAIPEGIYALFNHNPPKSFANWAADLWGNPDIIGFSLRYQWKDLQPTKATDYDWNAVIDQVRATADGGKYVFLFFQLAVAPDWIYTGGQNVPAFLYMALDKSGGTTSYVQMQIPLPWHTNYKARAKDFMTQLSARLLQRGGSNDLTDSQYQKIVKIGFSTPGGALDSFLLPLGQDPAGVYDTRIAPTYVHDYDYEWTTGKYTNGTVFTTNLYTDAKYETACKELAEHAALTFPDHYIGRDILIKGGSTDGSLSQSVHTVLENFVNTMVTDSRYGGSRVVLQVNNLNPKSRQNDEARYDWENVLEYHRLAHGTLLGFESGSLNPDFGGTIRDALLNAFDRGATYVQIYKSDVEDDPNGVNDAAAFWANDPSVETAPTVPTLLTVEPGSVAGELRVDFQAPGDDLDVLTSTPVGIVQSYIVKYSTSPITTAATFEAAPTFLQHWLPTRTAAAEGDERSLGIATAPYVYSKVLSGLQPGTVYWVAIKAVDDLGKVSTTFAVASGQSLETALPVLQITAPSNGLVATSAAMTVSGTITEANLDVASVKLKLNGLSITPSPTVGGTAPHYNFTANITLAVGVNTIDVEASDIFANPVTASVSVTLVPVAPSNLTATTFSPTAVDLAWKDNASNESNFRVEQKIGSGGTWLEIATVGGNTTVGTTVSRRLFNLIDGTQYYYRVRAFNSTGVYSSYANEASTITQLSRPTNASATAVSPSQIDLQWTDNSASETGFKIERKIGSTGTWLALTTLGANAGVNGIKKYSDKALVRGTKYVYRVRATNALVDSDYSGEATATTLP